MKNKYDIFISYRRTAYDTANLIAEKLRHAGYRVFFDVDTLTSGKFNEQLLEVIAECKDFVLVLPEDALKRCADEGDWIRRETVCALKHKKNIVPVMLDGFVWPEDIPQDMKELPNYQAIGAVNREYFDMQMERLKGYLKSKPSVPVKNWLTKAAIILAVLLAFVGVGFGVVRHVASVACQEIAAKHTNTAGAVDMLADIRQDIDENTSSFFAAIAKSRDEKERDDLENDLKLFLKRTERDVAKCKETFPAPDFTPKNMENYVLRHYGVKQEELDAFSAYYASFYDDFEELLDMLKEMLAEHEYSADAKDRVKMNLNCMQYSINAFYYGYLQLLSLLPKDARATHYQLAQKWKHFPNGTPLDLSWEEYEQFQAYEINRFQDEVEKYGMKVNYEERKLNELEEQIERLEEVARELNNPN